MGVMTASALDPAKALLAAGRAADAEVALASVDPSAWSPSLRAEHSLLLAQILAAQPTRSTLARGRAVLAAKVARLAGREDLAAEAAALERSLQAPTVPEASSVERLEKEAFEALQAGRALDAVRLLASAAREAQERGEIGPSARALFGQAVAMGPAGQGTADQREVLGQAVSRARLAGDPLTELKARQRIVRTWEEEQDWPAARAELEALLARVSDLGSDRGIADCRRHLATLEIFSGRPNAALAHAEVAITAAARTGDPALIAATRIERRALQSLALSTDREREGFADLRMLAENAGLTGLTSMVDLQEAAECLQAGQVKDGLAAAERGRVGALAAPDLLAYVQACLLIAEGRNEGGDRVGVLDVLLTCKATLEHHLGKEAGVAMVAVLDSLEGRWGAEALREARLGYRRQAAERVAREGMPEA